MIDPHLGDCFVSCGHFRYVATGSKCFPPLFLFFLTGFGLGILMKVGLKDLPKQELNLKFVFVFKRPANVFKIFFGSTLFECSLDMLCKCVVLKNPVKVLFVHIKDILNCIKTAYS